jgi:hypothetical protein
VPLVKKLINPLSAASTQNPTVLFNADGSALITVVAVCIPAKNDLH